jgi:hypothetical protein
LSGPERARPGRCQAGTQGTITNCPMQLRENEAAAQTHLGP